MLSPITVIFKILQCIVTTMIRVKLKKKKQIVCFLLKSKEHFWQKAVFILFVDNLLWILCSMFPKGDDGWKQKEDLPLSLVLAAAPWSDGAYWGDTGGYALLLKATEHVQLEETLRVQARAGWKSHSSSKPAEWAKTGKLLRRVGSWQTDRQIARVLESSFRFPETSVKLKVCCSVYIMLMEGRRGCCNGTEVRH